MVSEEEYRKVEEKIKKAEAAIRYRHFKEILEDKDKERVMAYLRKKTDEIGALRSQGAAFDKEAFDKEAFEAYLLMAHKLAKERIMGIHNAIEPLKEALYILEANTTRLPSSKERGYDEEVAKAYKHIEKKAYGWAEKLAERGGVEDAKRLLELSRRAHESLEKYEKIAKKGVKSKRVKRKR